MKQLTERRRSILQMVGGAAYREEEKQLTDGMWSNLQRGGAVYKGEVEQLTEGRRRSSLQMGGGASYRWKEEQLTEKRRNSLQRGGGTACKLVQREQLVLECD